MTIIGDRGELEIGLKDRFDRSSTTASKGKYVFQAKGVDVGYINEVRLVVSKLKLYHNILINGIMAAV